MMQTGADDREILPVGDGAVECQQSVLRNDRVGEYEECAIADQRLQMPQGLDQRSNQIGEVIDEIGGGEFAMAVREGGIPRNVDEAKGCLDGRAVIHASLIVHSEVCDRSGRIQHLDGL